MGRRGRVLAGLLLAVRLRDARGRGGLAAPGRRPSDLHRVLDEAGPRPNLPGGWGEGDRLACASWAQASKCLSDEQCSLHSRGSIAFAFSFCFLESLRYSSYLTLYRSMRAVEAAIT